MEQARHTACRLWADFVKETVVGEGRSVAIRWRGMRVGLVRTAQERGGFIYLNASCNCYLYTNDKAKGVFDGLLLSRNLLGRKLRSGDTIEEIARALHQIDKKRKSLHESKNWFGLSVTQGVKSGVRKRSPDYIFRNYRIDGSKESRTGTQGADRNSGQEVR